MKRFVGVVKGQYLYRHFFGLILRHSALVGAYFALLEIWLFFADSSLVLCGFFVFWLFEFIILWYIKIPPLEK